MTEEAVRAWIKEEEGKKGVIYLDTVGRWTCGYGHLLFLGDTVPQKAMDGFFEDDFDQAIDDLETLQIRYSLPPMGLVREAVLIGMLFQMGLTKVRKFKLMLQALKDEDWKRAAFEMLDSKWARDDTPARAVRAAEMMRSGGM